MYLIALERVPTAKPSEAAASFPFSEFKIHVKYKRVRERGIVYLWSLFKHMSEYELQFAGMYSNPGVRTSVADKFSFSLCDFKAQIYI